MHAHEVHLVHHFVIVILDSKEGDVQSYSLSSVILYPSKTHDRTAHPILSLCNPAGSYLTANAHLFLSKLLSLFYQIYSIT